MRVPNLQDGAVYDAGVLAGGITSARDDLRRLAGALVGDAGIVTSGYAVTLTAAGIAAAAGTAFDSQGRAVDLRSPRTLTPGRPAAGKWRWVTISAAWTEQGEGDTYDLDGARHDLWRLDGATLTVTAGADADSKAAAVRPAIPAGNVLIADVAIDAASAWTAFTADTYRRWLPARPPVLISSQVRVTLKAVYAAVHAVLAGAPLNVWVPARGQMTTRVHGTLDDRVSIAAIQPRAAGVYRFLLEWYWDYSDGQMYSGSRGGAYFETDGSTFGADVHRLGTDAVLDSNIAIGNAGSAGTDAVEYWMLIQRS